MDKYRELVHGLAAEMLEKVASESEEMEVVAGEEGCEEVELTEEEIEQLAEELYGEALAKTAAEYTEEEEMEVEASEEEEDLEKEAGVVSRLMGSKEKLHGLKAAYGQATKGMNVAKGQLSNDMAKHYANKRGAIRNAIKAEKKAVRNTRIGVGAAAAGTAAMGAGAANMLLKNKAQEKAASYYEEAEFLKQAAEEAYNEAILMQEAAAVLYNNFEDEE